MKSILFVLSDIHMKDSQYINRDIVRAMANVINTIEGVGNIGVVIAGDLTYSGQVNEYKKIKMFCGFLISEINRALGSTKFINFYVVPGNHDINFEGKNRNRDDILQNIRSGNVESLVNDEINKFGNFYEFAEYNNCFKTEKIVDMRIFYSGFMKIQINLLNSELFSTLNDEKGDDDKGVHYFPEEKIGFLSKRKFAKYVMSVMHRSPEWFEYDSMKKLKNKLYENSNIVIFGHEHNADLSLISRKENETLIINTGMFDFAKEEYKFSVISFDEETNVCDVFDYKWEEDERLFRRINSISSELIEINLDIMKPVNEFTKEFYYMENDNNIEDIFVFPDLEKKNLKETTSIKDIDDFFEKLKSNNVVYIEGNRNSGKSMLCKALYKKSYKLNMTPIYINMENAGNKKYKNLIHNAFSEQYGYDKDDFEKFNQKGKAEKIVIVDNLDRVDQESLKTFCDNIETEFKNVVYTYTPSDKSNIVEEIKKNIDQQNNKYTILPFYLRKRKELINKLVQTAPIKIKKNQEKIEELNKFISDQLRIFSLDPSFITRYVDYYIKNNEHIESQSNVFGKVFESNITCSLQKVTSNDNIEEYYTVLELLAYKVHFSKKCPFGISDINEVISKYNDEYMMKVDSSDFRKNIIKANIVDDIGDDKYRFSNNSYLAYFTAKALSKKINELEGKEDLNWICKNLCFNINGEILLFLSYITNNKLILSYIFERTNEITSMWKEFDILNNNISFLSGNISEDIKLPTLKDQDKNDENLEKQEKAIIKNLSIKTKEIYDDYDETKIGSKQYVTSQAIGYLELICKILPNFNHDLKKEEKIQLVHSIYSCPNKICNEIFQNVDSNLQKTIDDLMNYCKIKNLKLTKEEIVVELEKSAMYFILNLFDIVARLSVNLKTIETLNIENLDSINDELLNMMMYENLGKFTIFAEKANKIYDSNKKQIIKTMVRLVIQKHFICNKNLKQVHYVQKIADKYFGNNRKYLK